MTKSNDAIMHSVDSGLLLADLETGFVYNKRGKRIKGTKNSQGYLITHAYLPDGSMATVLQHRVIAYAAFGAAALMEDTIDHINHIRDDNGADNLRAVTYKENSNNATHRKRGTWKAVADETINAIRGQYVDGASAGLLSESYSISIATVYNITRGKAAYSGYEPITKTRHSSQSDWAEFWEDVDAGTRHAVLTQKYGLSYSAIAHRIERRR